MKENDQNTTMQEISVFGVLGNLEFDLDIEIEKSKWDYAVNELIEEYIGNIDEEEINEEDVVDGKVVNMPGLSASMEEVLRVCSGFETLRKKMIETFEEEGMSDCEECIMLNNAEDMESFLEESSELTIYDRYPDILIDAVRQSYKRLYEEQFEIE